MVTSFSSDNLYMTINIKQNIFQLFLIIPEQQKGGGPPCSGGPVRWRWEICIYIKGGEMERLF